MGFHTTRFQRVFPHFQLWTHHSSSMPQQQVHMRMRIINNMFITCLHPKQ
jgi:hypothetical protein